MAKDKEDPKKKLEETSEELGFIKDQIRSLGVEITEALTDRFDESLSMVERVSKRIKNITLKETEKSLISTVKGLDKTLLLSNKLANGSITIKDIESAKLDLAQRQILAQQQIQTLTSVFGKDADGLKETQQGIAEALEKQKTILKKQEEDYKKLQKSLGATGDIIKGISKIPILGNLINAEEALVKIQNEAAKGSSKFDVMKVGIKAMGKSLITNLFDPLTLITGGIVGFLKIFGEVDSLTGDLAKSMNLTYLEASSIRGELNLISLYSNDIAINTKNLQETLMSVNSILGINTKLNKEDLITWTKLREQAGYTNEELAGVYKISTLNNKTLKENTSEFLGSAKAASMQNGLLLNEKQLLKDIGKISNSIKLSLNGSAKEIAEAVVAAKKLGVNLGDVEQISNSLMDFEQSIANELEAELLTGKQLNLERARLAALNNDYAKVAKEINKQLGSAVDFSSMNRIQQEALAKSIGMSRDSLAEALINQEALTKLSGIEGKTAQDKWEKLVAQVGLEKARIQLGNESLSQQFEQQSNQEKFNNTIEKLKETFVSIADSLMPVFHIFTGILDVVGLILTPIGKIMEWADSFGNVGKNIVGVLTAAAIAATIMMGSLTFGLAALGTLAAAGGIMALLESNKQSINDGIISPDGGLVVSGEKGTYQLNEDDSIIAGTDIGKNKITPKNITPPPNESFMINRSISKTTNNNNFEENNTKLNMDEVVKELKDVKTTLNKILEKEGNVYMDSTKVGTAINVGTYKTQ